MANISAIKLPNGNTYTIVDSTIPSVVKNISATDVSTWNNKQDGLVSGTNIKTINGSSILGTGDLTISAGQTAYVSKIENTFTTTAASTTTVPIGITGYNSTTDMLFVDINGLDLISGTDYTISGTNITLTTPITTTGTKVHFVVIRMVAVSAEDYTTLKGEKGDKGDPGVDGTHSISYTPIITGGSQIGTITIDNTSYALYAPAVVWG